MTAKASLTHCGHGISYRAPCAECDELWRAECVASLRKRAAKLGYALVPREPTDAMLEAVRDETIGCCNLRDPEARDIYRAMVAAANPD